MALRPIEVHDNGDGFNAKYELSYDVDGIKFTENTEVKIRVGIFKKNR